MASPSLQAPAVGVAASEVPEVSEAPVIAAGGGGDEYTAGAGPAHVALPLTGHCVPEVDLRVVVCAGKPVGSNRLAPEVRVIPHVPVLQL